MANYGASQLNSGVGLAEGVDEDGPGGYRRRILWPRC